MFGDENAFFHSELASTSFDGRHFFVGQFDDDAHA